MASHSARPEKQLYDLLMELYPSQQALRRDLKHLELTARVEAELPGEISSRAHVVQGAVDVMTQHGVVTEPLFAFYLDAYRRHQREIVRVAEAFGVLLGKSVLQPPAPVDSLPPGTPWAPQHYIRWGKPEKRATRLLKYPGKPVVVYGPPRVGKSWFLHQILHDFPEASPVPVRTVRIDLDDASTDDRDDYPSFLKWLTFCMQRELAPDAPSADELWENSRHPNTTFTDFLRQHILLDDGGLVLIALDRADRVRLAPFNDDFFALLRARLTDPGEPWDRVRVMVALSADPKDLTANKNASLFHGLSRPMQLEGFSDEQLIQLGSQYELKTSERDLLAMMSDVKKTPYHLRDVLFEAVLDAEDD